VLSATLVGECAAAELVPKLTTATSKAAIAALAGNSLTDFVSANAAALAQGASHTMSLSKPLLAAFVLAGLLTGGIVLAGSFDTAQPPAEEPPAAGKAKNPAKDDAKAQQAALPEGAIARLGSGEWRNLSDSRSNIVFSLDGSAVITQSSGSIQMVDFETGRELWRIEGLRGDGSFILIPENRIVAVDFESLRIHDLQTGKEQERAPFSVFNPQNLTSHGNIIALSDPLGKVRGATVALDLKTGRKLWHVGGDREGYCHPLGFIDGGTELVLWVSRPPDTWIRMIDTNTQKMIREWKLPAGVQPIFANHAVLSPDGKYVCGGSGKDIRLWNVATGKEALVLSGHADEVIQAVFFSDGKRLVTSGKDRTLRWWDLATGKGLGRIELGRLAYRLAVSPDGQRVVAACSGSNSLHRFDLNAGREIPLADGHTSLIEHLAFVPDGSTLLTASRDGSVRVWDLASQKTVRSWEPDHLGGPRWLAVSPNGKLAATASYNDAIIRLWDIGSGKELQSIKQPSRAVGCVVFAPEDLTLISSGEDTSPEGARVVLWDANTGQELREFSGHFGGSSGIAFDLGGQSFVSVPGRFGVMYAQSRTSHQMTAQITNIKTGRVQSRTGRLDNAIALDPSGRSIAVIRQPAWGGNIELVLAEAATGQERLKFDYLPIFGPPLAFSRDGRILVTPGARNLSNGDRINSCVILHDTGTGKEICRLDTGQSSAFGFSPDGKTLATGGNDGTVLLWDMSKIKTPETGAKLEPEKHWPDLAREAPAAFQAIIAIAQAGEAGVTLARDRLKPATPLDRKQLARLLGDLDSPQFPVRQKAAQELAALGDHAGDALRDRLKTATSAEARKSISALLEKLDGWLTNPQALREVRAIEALERNEALAARQLLEELAKGDPAVRLTREAQAALRWKDHLTKLREK
jgi:WD40 repeat protein